MKLDYQQTYKKEILTEFASSIYEIGRAHV